MTGSDLNQKIAQRSIQADTTILSALKRMDQIDRKLLLVFRGDHFEGLVSIGDIQRAIIANKPLETQVSQILRKQIRLAGVADGFDQIKKVMIEFRTECMPIIDDHGKLVDILFWEDIFPQERSKKKRDVRMPVVVMAGGKGLRLRPLTNILPKPLIPLDERTIVEHIMERFENIGCNEFYMTLNYKADLIRYYLDGLDNKERKIHYFQETKPLGTAGSLHLLKGSVTSRFFVTNCDILVDEDYREIVDFHCSNNHELTLISALKHISIPYGTLETGKEGALLSLAEKPEITYKVNTGVYILEPHLLDQIPENIFFNLTDLIHDILERKGKIGVFPVSENSWRDIGDWNEYLRSTQPNIV